MFAHDEHHWWYRGRRRVLRSALERLALPAGGRLLDAGCGSGRTLDELALYGDVSGVDLSPDAVRLARDRGHREVSVGPIERLPFEDGTFDLVTCMDVIEHTPDDAASLRELRRVTRPGAMIVLTVPAHPLLWSTHDEVNRHHRRYTRRMLTALAAGADVQVLGDTYFNSLLLIPAAAIRWMTRLRRGESQRSDLERTPRALNRLLEQPIALEARLIARGKRIPVGLSLLCVLRRPSRDSPATPSAEVGLRDGGHDEGAEGERRHTQATVIGDRRQRQRPDDVPGHEPRARDEHGERGPAGGGDPFHSPVRAPQQEGEARHGEHARAEPDAVGEA